MSQGHGSASPAGANLISIGRYDGVWFGSRKRAQELLQFRREVIPIHDAVRWLQEALLDEYPGALLRVLWVDQELDKDRSRFTVAICYMQSRPGARQLLFELGKTMVEATGWYPLAHGEPLGGAGKSTLCIRTSEGTGCRISGWARLRCTMQPMGRAAVLLDCRLAPSRFYSTPDMSGLMLLAKTTEPSG